MAITSDPLQPAGSNPASVPTVLPRRFASATCGSYGENTIGEQLATWARTPIGLAFLLTAGTLLGLALMKLLALLGWAMDWAWLRDNPILRSGSDNCTNMAACLAAAGGAAGGSGGPHYGRGGKGPLGTGGKLPGGGGTGGKGPGGGGGSSGGGGTGGKPSGPPTGPDPNWKPRDPGTDPVTGQPDLGQPQNPNTPTTDNMPPDWRPYAGDPSTPQPAEAQPDPNNPQGALAGMSDPKNYPPPGPAPLTGDQIMSLLTRGY
jgi:hypothetical protein